MIRKVRQLSWFEENCKKGEYDDYVMPGGSEKDDTVVDSMLKYCGKEIDIVYCQHDGWYFAEWMLEPIENDNKIDDNIHHPDHYTWMPGIECKEVAKHFDFFKGSAIKYIWRSGKKENNSEIDDLEKSIECLKNEIELIKSRQNEGAIQ